MGNNVYETPRNKSKWHTTGDKKENNPTFKSDNDKSARLQKLKEQVKRNKEQARKHD